MTRTRTLFATLALTLAVPAAVIGCGGDDGGGGEDPEEVLTATFENDAEVTSGNLEIGFGFSAGDQGSFDASLSGPFQANPDDPQAIPQLDLAASLNGEGQGQTVDFSGGLTVTEDNAYVTYQDQAYEVGTDTFSQLKAGAEEAAAAQEGTGDATGIAAFTQQCESAVETAGGDAAACDIDFASWLENLTNEGTEDVEGTESTHISGDANVAQIIEDLTALSEATGGSSGVTSDQLTQAQEAISEAGIDVYSSTDDNLLTKLDATFSIDPSAIESSTPVPLTEPIDFNFSIAIGDVNSEQTIEAPADAQPIDELLGQFGFGGLGALGGLEGLGGGGLGGDTGGSLDLGGGTGGGGTGGGGSSSTGDATAYFDCIEAAGSDANALQACESQL